MWMRSGAKNGIRARESAARDPWSVLKVSEKKKNKSAKNASSGFKQAARSAASQNKPEAGTPSSELASWRGIVGEGQGDRADKFIADGAGILSRSQLKARDAHILVNAKPEKLSRRLAEGDIVEVFWTKEPSHSIEPEKLDVSLLYEDENVFVFDKAQGMVTHPAAGNWRGTLANAALWLDAERRGAATCAAPRGGIVHRLDKDTSGVIIVARNVETHEFLASQFKNRSTRKEYIALVCGSLPDMAGRVENRLARDKRDRKKFAECESDGKPALTDYRALARWEIGAPSGSNSISRYALVALFPKTGRTHQLRVHMAGLGCPILGDPIYGGKDKRFPAAGLMLHARKLRISIPGDAEPRVFAAPIPSRFREIVAELDAKGRRL
jgi:23S rRNA pseudouridine1911/1915/1917 synthase